MDNTKKYRYPGAPPFSFDDRQVFFGREEDIEKLYKFVGVEQLVVLISKSGLGKSSLLNAGLVPRFLQSGNHKPVSLWFSSFRQEGDALPLQLLLGKIDNDTPQKTFLDKLITGEKTLWHYLKIQQLNQNNDKGFLLIFDQFENFFTYPEESRNAFKQQLAAALNVKIPQQLLRTFQEKLSDDPGFLTEEEKALLFKPLDIKVLLAIRSDKMNLLHSLKDVLPNVLKKTYELAPLNRIQAEDAIVFPAYKKDTSFYSKPFDFSDQALEKIIYFLTKNGELNEVESAQLQILCQYIEENIVIGQEKTIVEADDLGNIETIFSNYYDNIIQGLPESEQRYAQVFLEEGLIFEEDERRLPLDEKQIGKLFQVSDASLTYLVNKRLLRSQPNQTGGFSFELSHDTLVKPILKAKHIRLRNEAAALEEEKRKARQIKLQNEIKAANKRIKRRSIAAILILILMSGLTYYFFQTERRATDLNKKLETTVSELESKKNSLEQAKDTLLAKETELKKNVKRADSNATVARANAEEAFAAKREALKNKNDAIVERNKAEETAEQLKITFAKLNRNNALAFLENAKEEREAKNYNTAKLYSLFALQQAKYLTPYERDAELKNIRSITDYPVDVFDAGFTQKMKHFAVSPGDKWVASCGFENNNIHVWEQSSGKIYRILQGHDQQVNASSFSSNTKILASASDDNTVKIWNLESGTVYHNLYEHNAPVKNVLYAPKGPFMASASDNRIILWDTNGYRVVQEFKDVSVGKNNMAFSSDGENLAYVQPDNSIRLVRLSLANGGGSHKNKEEPKALKGHSDRINCLVFSPDGNFLVSGASDNKVVIFNIKTGDPVATLPEHTAKITSLAFSPDGQFLASGDGDNLIKIWNFLKITSKTDKNQVIQEQVGLYETPTIQTNQMIQSFTDNGESIKPGNKQKKETISSIASLQNHHHKVVGLQFFGGATITPESRPGQQGENKPKALKLASLGNDERQIKIWEFPLSNTVGVNHVDSAFIHDLIGRTLQKFNLNSSSNQQLSIYRSPLEILHEQAETTSDIKQRIKIYDSILKINTSEYEAIYRVAYDYYSLGEYSKSGEYYAQYLQYYDKDYLSWNALGNTYYAIADFEKAIDAYNQSIDANPRYNWPYINRGLSYFSLGNNRKALNSFYTAEELNPISPGLWNYIGNVYYSTRNYDSATIAYEMETGIDPMNKWAWYNLGLTYSDQKDEINAIKYYKKSLEVDPYYRDAWINLGNLYYNTGKFAKSAESLIEARAIDPEHIDTWFYLGGVASKASFDDAIRFYKKALEIDSSYSILWNNLGMAYFKQGKYNKAIESFQKALLISPESPTYLVNLANSFTYLNKPESAATLYDKIINQRLADDSANLDITGFAYLKTGKIQKAYEYFKKAERINPEDAITKRSWGCYYAANNRPAKAIELLTESFELGYLDYEWFLNEPSLKSIQNEKSFVILIDKMKGTRGTLKKILDKIFKTAKLKTSAELLYYDNNYVAAIEQYEEAYALQPGDTVLRDDYLFTLEDYAYLLLDDEKYHEAAEKLDKIIQIAPTYFTASDLNEIGNKFSNSTHDTLALIYYLRAVLKDPSYYWTWANLGNTYNRLGQTEKAIDAYRNTLNIQPDYLYAINGLGIIHQNAANYDSALFYFQEALSYDPSYSYSLNNIANNYLFQGDTLKAKNVFLKVIGYENDNTYALSYLVLLYSLEKQYDSVVYYAQQQASFNLKSANDWGNMGWYYLFVKKFDDALSASEYALQLDSTAIWTRVNLAHALLLMDEYEKAKKEYLEIQDLLWNNEPLRKSILADFATLTDAGIYHPDMDRIKAILKEK